MLHSDGIQQSVLFCCITTSRLGLGRSWYDIDDCAISETSDKSIDKQQCNYWASIGQICGFVEQKYTSSIRCNYKQSSLHTHKENLGY